MKRIRHVLVAVLMSLGLAGPAQASNESVKQIIRDVWPDHLEDQAIAVARCESTLKPSAHRRGSQYKGLFQMGRREWAKYGAGGNPYDPWANAAAALRLHDDRGWRPWTCRRVLS